MRKKMFPQPFGLEFFFKKETNEWFDGKLLNAINIEKRYANLLETKIGKLYKVNAKKRKQAGSKLQKRDVSFSTRLALILHELNAIISTLTYF